jgi:outer membrane receptor for ferrienterochelin and colicins
MNKNIVTLILIILGLVKYSFCQTITVLSSEDKQPIPSAHIILKNMTTLKEEIVLTDSQGRVNIQSVIVPNSVFTITISSIGYQKISDTISFIQNRTYYLSPEKVILNEVVVTAQYAPNSPEKAVHKVKVIDRKKIQLMAAQNLRDVLTNEMNIRISQDNVLGSSMSLQGISGQNVKILIDGVPVTGRLNGNIDISQINMNNVERIEIVEGPLSVNYGTNALAGTINIITNKTQKETLSILSDNYYESNGQYNFNGRIGYSKNKNILTLSGGRNYFDGWNTNDKPFYYENKPVADTTRYKSWKPKEQYFGTIYYGRYINNLKLGYTFDYFNEQITNRGYPLPPYYKTAFDDYYYTNRINNSLSLAGQINKNYYTNILFAYNHYQRVKNTYFKDLTTLVQKLTENESDQDTTIFNELTARGSISTTKDSAKLNYEIGYDIFHETGFGLRIKDRQQEIKDYAIFGSAEYKPFSKLTLRPGLRVIYNTAYKAPIIPSLNLRYSINNTHTLRISYARGFRAPSLKEIYLYFVDINHNIVGNPNLKAEQSHNFNISMSFNKTKGNTIWKTENSFFYNYIENMISLAQITGAEYTYFNVDKFQTLGLQLQTELAWQHFKFSIGGAYIGRYNQLSVNYPLEKFTYTPEGRCNLFYEWHKQNITFALFYKYTGKLPSFIVNNNNEVYQTIIQDYNTADISISKLFWKKRINLSIGSKNIFNVKNVSGFSTGGVHSSNSSTVSIGMGRTYFFKLAITLNSNK